MDPSKGAPDSVSPLEGAPGSLSPLEGAASSISSIESRSGSIPPIQFSVSTPGAQRFSLWHVLTTYGATIGASLLQLVNVLIVARTLGPSGRGDVAFLTTVAGITGQLALFGIHRAVANFTPRDPRLGPSLATNSLLPSFLLGGIAIGVVALLVALVPAAGAHEPTLRRWVALASIPFVILSTCLNQLLRAYDDHSVANLAWLIIPVTTAFGNATLWLAGGLTATSAVAMWVGGQGLACALLIGALIHRHTGFGRPDRRLTKAMFGFGIKTHGSQVMLLSNYRLDQWLLGAISGSRELGIYSVAVAWSEGLFFLPTALEQVQRPDLVRGTPQQAAWRATRVFRACWLLTILLALGMWLLAPFLCVTIFGSSFRHSVWQLRILALGAFGIGALKLLGDALTSQRRPFRELGAIAVAFVCILTLDLLLIPRHGGNGAALGSTIAYSAGGVAVIVMFLRTLPARARELLPSRADFIWVVQRLRAALR